MPHASEKILFITSNRVGDAVLSTGILAWLVENHPQARMTIACGPYASDLFRATPRLDRLIILNKKSWNRHWLKLWNSCFRTRWTLIVDLRNSAISRLLSADKRFVHRRGTGQHKVIDNAAILHLKTPPAPHLWLDAAAQQVAEHLIPPQENVIALGPAANWPPKQWPILFFAQLARKLTALDGLFPKAKILVLAEEREREQITPLLESIPLAQRIEVIGYDLLAAAACLKKCQLFIGNDSGLMHIAAASGIPTLGLFGPGYEEIYGPWGAQGQVVRTPESREELLGRLPNMAARAPNLMEGLDVETVYQATVGLIKNRET